MKYKAGDQVRIKSLDWYNKNIKNNGIIICGSESFTHPMSHFCDKVVTIVTIQDNCYRILEDDGDWYWTDEMIEGLVEEETASEKILEARDKHYWDMLGGESKNEITLPQGYQFVDENGNVINATMIVLEKKKKEYPKTYEECYKIMGVKLSDCYIQGYKSPLLEDLQELLICRDAYWKIAGEDMGLGKPWEPDWTYNGATKYCIGVSENEIQNFSSGVAQYILAFPTAEMRDAFYENFKELIEQCKELL